MTSLDSPQRSSSSAVLLCAVVLLAPVLYVLSMGPVVALVERGSLPHEPIEFFYAPVIWLHNHTALEKPLEWYGALWGWH